MLHVMLDLETFGTKPWSVIRSIGAVSFDLRNSKDEFLSEFYVNVDRASCEAHGLASEKSVEEWWNKQSPESRAVLEKDQQSLETALTQLADWYKSTGATTVWSQGSAFDFPILETAFSFALKRKPPWHYRRVRDTRTAYHILGFDFDSMERGGVYHDALDDCKHQTRALKKALFG